MQVESAKSKGNLYTCMTTSIMLALQATNLQLLYLDNLVVAHNTLNPVYSLKFKLTVC